MREVFTSRTAQGGGSLDNAEMDLVEMDLSCAPAGCRLRVKRLCNSPKEQCRLCALGLTPGTVIQVLDSGRGLMRLMVRGCALVLDCSLARLVTCVPAEQQAA